MCSSDLKTKLADANQALRLSQYDPEAYALAKQQHDKINDELDAFAATLGTGATSGAAGGQPQKTLDQYKQEGYGIVTNQ